MTDRPLTLDASPRPDGVTLRVRGAADRAVEATFVLEVRAGSNRSTHRGAVRLSAGDAAILSTISVSTGAARDWDAALHVSPSPGEPYTLRSRAD